MGTQFEHAAPHPVGVDHHDARRSRSVQHGAGDEYVQHRLEAAPQPRRGELDERTLRLRRCSYKLGGLHTAAEGYNKFTPALPALALTKALSARNGSAASAACVPSRAAARALCASPEFLPVDPQGVAPVKRRPLVWPRAARAPAPICRHPCPCAFVHHSRLRSRQRCCCNSLGHGATTAPVKGSAVPGGCHCATRSADRAHLWCPWRPARTSSQAPPRPP